MREVLVGEVILLRGHELECGDFQSAQMEEDFYVLMCSDEADGISLGTLLIAARSQAGVERQPAYMCRLDQRHIWQSHESAMHSLPRCLPIPRVAPPPSATTPRQFLPTSPTTVSSHGSRPTQDHKETPLTLSSDLKPERSSKTLSRFMDVA